MRISDWSSDVCSSDLHTLECIRCAEALAGFGQALAQQAHDPVDRGRGQLGAGAPGQLGKPGTEGQYVRLGDGPDWPIADIREQVGVALSVSDGAAIERAA